MPSSTRPTARRTGWMAVGLAVALPLSLGAQDPTLLERAAELEREATARLEQHDWKAGVAMAREAVALRERALGPNHPDLANGLQRLSISLRITGDYPGARDALERALAIRERAFGPDDPRVADALQMLGFVLRVTGEYERSRRFLERALRIHEHALGPDSYFIVKDIDYLVSTLMSVGDYAAARPHLERAVRFFEERNPHGLDTADRLTKLGRLLLLLGDSTAARARVEQAIRNARLAGPANPPLARALDVFADILEAEGDLARARPLRERSLGIIEQAYGPEAPWVADSNNDFAELLRRLGDLSGARRHYDRALHIAMALRAPEPRWRAALGLGSIHESQGRLAEALASYQEAVNTLEPLVAQFGEEWRRSRYLEAAQGLAAYDALARLLLKLHEREPGQGYDRRAFAVLEAKKGRMAAEALSAAGPTTQDPRIRAEEEQVRAQLDRGVVLERELREKQAEPPSRQDAAAIRKLTTVLAETKAEYLAQRDAFLKRYPKQKARFVDQQTIDPLILAKLADRLPPSMLAVQYFSAPDAMYLFVVAPGGQLQVKRQAIPQTELYRLIREYRQHLRSGERRALPWSDDRSEVYSREVAPFKALTRTLALHLLGPVEPELARHRNLLLVPNDLLLYMPIHALERRQSDGSTRFLAETHIVSYATQLDLVDLLSSDVPRRDTPLLALADPDGSLPGAGEEVRALLRIRPSARIFEGPEATKAQFLSLAAGFPDLHLATHGFFDPERPERSYLLMAGTDEASRRLSLGEIMGLQLPRGLAVLSACDTAMGEQVPGAALVTLAAAFNVAGAQAIVASLWKAEDAATRDFMVAFHGALVTSDRAAALHRAQSALIAEPRTAHPFYWASFVLIGAR